MKQYISTKYHYSKESKSTYTKDKHLSSPSPLSLTAHATILILSKLKCTSLRKNCWTTAKCCQQKLKLSQSTGLRKHHTIARGGLSSLK